MDLDAPEATGGEHCGRHSSQDPAAAAAIAMRRLSASGWERWHFTAGGPEATDRLPHEGAEG